jgi:hypothetical protein
MVGCVQGYIPEGHLSLFTSFNSDIHIMLSSFASEASGFIFHCEQRKHLRRYKSSSNNVTSRHALLRKFCDTWNKRQSCLRARHDRVGEDEIWLHSFLTSTLGEMSGPVHRVLHIGSEAVWWPLLVWAFWRRGRSLALLVIAPRFYRPLACSLITIPTELLQL